LIRYSTYPLIASAILISLGSYVSGLTYVEVAAQIFIWIIIADIIIFHRVSVRALKAVEVKRSIVSGKRTVELAFRNRASTRIHFAFEDRNNISGEEMKRGELTIPPYAESLIHYPLKGEFSGRWRIGPIRLWTRDEMQLCHFGEQRYIITEIPVAASPDVIRRVRPGAAHRRRQRLSALQGSQFSSVREYVEGDETRYIAWSMTGRRGEEDLYVKQMEPETNVEIDVLVDYSIYTLLGGKRRIYDAVMKSLLALPLCSGNENDSLFLLLYSTAVRKAAGPAKGRMAVRAISTISSEVFPEGIFDAGSAMRSLRSIERRLKPVLMISPLIGVRSLPDARSYHHPIVLLVPEAKSFLTEERWEQQFQRMLLPRRRALEQGYFVLHANAGEMSEKMLEAWEILKGGWH
jgi:uncharacterized protein (DUF58 family)